MDRIKELISATNKEDYVKFQTVLEKIIADRFKEKLTEATERLKNSLFSEGEGPKDGYPPGEGIDIDDVDNVDEGEEEEEEEEDDDKEELDEVEGDVDDADEDDDDDEDDEDEE